MHGHEEQQDGKSDCGSWGWSSVKKEGMTIDGVNGDRKAKVEQLYVYVIPVFSSGSREEVNARKILNVLVIEDCISNSHEVHSLCFLV
ncbi:hypothetical protein E2C01_024169 [Portunus trituberculatus]|uniref:Uncharacterized protein n=1 Tax=Portunus trituberculatus TaxID=210409 RepID=A0A5B7EBW3_PORTR|nr:hypothetical protein [Portunus trituberculatus]